MKAWSDFTIICNEHVFGKSDGAMAMKIDIVRHIFSALVSSQSEASQ